MQDWLDMKRWVESKEGRARHLAQELEALAYQDLEDWEEISQAVAAMFARWAKTLLSDLRTTPRHDSWPDDQG